MSITIITFKATSKRGDEIIVTRTIDDIKTDNTYNIAYYFLDDPCEILTEQSQDFAFKIVFDEIMASRRDGIEYTVHINTLGEIPV